MDICKFYVKTAEALMVGRHIYVDANAENKQP